MTAAAIDYGKSTASARLQGAVEAAPKKILVADDDKHMRVLLTHLLETRGYCVSSAAGGQEALDQVPSFRPNLIVLDLELPDISGSEVCHRLKSESATENIPVLVVSGRPDIADQARISQADGYLEKPFRLSELAKRVGLLCEAVSE